MIPYDGRRGRRGERDHGGEAGAEAGGHEGRVRGWALRALRRDDAQQPDLTHIVQTVLLLRNNFKYQLTPSWRVLGKLDHSISDSSLGDFYAGGYTEAVVGYAYRPVRNDRLNALVKYTYFYNVPTPDQFGLQNIATEFLQKSHIAALDVNYDLTAAFSVGGKYAYRLGQASLDRVDPTFFNNTAQLSVLRLDYRFLKQWDSLAEVRQLGLPDLNQQRRGLLTAVYHKIGKLKNIFTATMSCLFSFSFLCGTEYNYFHSLFFCF